METVIQVEDLTYSYGSNLALNDLTFSVQPGEVLGLLGPNGAGKTTTVRLINGLFPPTRGSIRALGFDPVIRGDQIRRRSGVLTETPALYERLTARQNLEFFGAMAGMRATDCRRRSEELLHFFGLDNRAGDRVETYSKGMKQRLALARALLHKPALLFLDEPTSGLDPEAAAQVHDLITSVRSHNGQTVVLCTHNLFEAERLCDRLAIMNGGQLLALGSLDELRRLMTPGMWVEIEFLTSPPLSATEMRPSLPGVQKIEGGDATTWRFKVNAESAIPPIVSRLAQQGALILSVQPRRASLEAIYFELQNQQQRGAA